MMRPLLLWASTNPYMKDRLPRYGFVRRAVRRFMPGERAEDGLREAEVLARAGASTILTLLGENVDAEDEAQAVASHYLGVLKQVRSRKLNAEVSVKLTQLGLDQSPTTALAHVRTLARASAEASTVTSNGGTRPLTLWIDMESSAYVDRTLEIYRAVKAEHDNVGVALQAYLHRTPKDFESLLPLRPIVRLVKGAYLEPKTVALPSKREVDAAYHALVKRLLRERKAGRVGRPSIATHDPRITGDVTRMARELDLPKDAYEFAMLYGIGTGQQRHLLGQGYRLRVLISYGEAWFPWYMRRLAERPANLWFVAKQMVKG
jgi:proline dehydrogenase